MASRFFKSSWGSVELWMSRISTDDGRKLVVSQFTRGNTPDVQNRGGNPRTAHVSLLFDEMVGQKDTGNDRLLALVTLKDQGKPQVFTHPFYGTYLAEIEDFTWEIDENQTITGSATFVPTEEVGAFVHYPVGVSPDFTVDDVAARSVALTTELGAVGVTSTIPDLATRIARTFDDANGAVDAQGQRLASARDVLVGISSLSEQANNEIDTLGLQADILLWPAMKAYVMLADAGRAAGIAALGDQGSMMTLLVNSPTSLRRLMADLYGGADADARADEARDLNDIRTPARIPSGTQLRLRQPTV